MTHSRNLVLFVLGIAGAFFYICNVIPQIKSEPVAVETEIGESPEELISAGKKIFMSDRAQCLTCHTIGEDPKARCPNQEALGERAPKRISGMSGPAYLVESVYNPNAFVVPGYPKNQMTPVNKPPIALSHDEILAVIAFLNTLGGRTDAEYITEARKAQDPWRKGLLQPEEGVERETLPIFRGDVERGREAFTKQACVQCHKVGAEGRDICPDLSAIGASQSAEYILESILDPNAVIVKGYTATIVVWKDQGKVDLRGAAVRWIPDKERPERLVLGVQELGQTVEREVDLADVAFVGDTTVAAEVEGNLEIICGEYLSGDEKSGVVIKVLERGQWLERKFPPEVLSNVNFPVSPMPSNFAQILTPRDVYDLVAYLLAQKKKKEMEKETR